MVGAGRYGYEGNSQGKRKSAEELARNKRQEKRELMPEMQSFRAIENTIVIRLSPHVIEELKEIAIENRQLTYSDLIIFLVKKYHESHTRDSS